jgi:hypothetical protein
MLFTGCANFNRIANYPTPNTPVNVAVVAKSMSKMSELPLGAYYDEPRQIIINGHWDLLAELGWGMIFGPVSVQVGQANKSSVESRFRNSVKNSGSSGKFRHAGAESGLWIAGASGCGGRERLRGDWSSPPAPNHNLL